MSLPSHGQAAMLRYIVRYFLQNGVLPSTRDAQREFNYASQTAVLSNWNALVKKGILKREEEVQARSYQPVWGKLVEYAFYIWPENELHDYLVRVLLDTGEQEEHEYKLPDAALIQFQLLQEGRRPKYFSYKLQ